MVKISANYAAMLKIFMEQSHKETFGKFLTPSYKFMSLDAKGFLFSYTVPYRLCRQFVKSDSENDSYKPQLSTAGVMAVFDQLSTYGLMALDKTRPRGGVSVLLSTEILKPIIADEDVMVVSKCDKIGKSLGFCTMELQTIDGSVLARGKHIKYLPLGKVWDIITHPWVLPTTIRFHDAMKSSTTFRDLAAKFTNIPKHHNKGFPQCEDTGSVFEVLGLVRSASRLDGLPAGTHQFDLAMRPHLVNNIGKLHGGAVAAVVEEACYLSRSDVLVSDGERGSSNAWRSDFFVQSIEARYETAMEVSPKQNTITYEIIVNAQGDLVVTCTDDHTSPLLSSGQRSVTTGTVCNKKDGQVCAEYVCRWAPVL